MIEYILDAMAIVLVGYVGLQLAKASLLVLIFTIPWALNGFPKLKFTRVKKK